MPPFPMRQRDADTRWTASMALARMTPERRALLAQLARQPQDENAEGLLDDLTALGFAERRDSRWHITRSGKMYLKDHR